MPIDELIDLRAVQRIRADLVALSHSKRSAGQDQDNEVNISNTEGDVREQRLRLYMYSGTGH